MRISLQDLLPSTLYLILTLRHITAVLAGAIRSTVHVIGKAFTVELEAFRLFTVTWFGSHLHRLHLLSLSLREDVYHRGGFWLRHDRKVVQMTKSPLHEVLRFCL